MEMVWCSKCLYTLLLLLIVNSVDWSVGRPSVSQSVKLLADNNRDSNLKSNNGEEGGSEVASNRDQQRRENNEQLSLDQDKLIEFNQELRLKLLEQLGFHETIPISTYAQETNISRAEYLRAYTEYMSNVRERRRRERSLVSRHPKVRRSQAEIFVQHYTTTTTANTKELSQMTNGTNHHQQQVNLDFPLKIQSLLQPSKSRLQMREAALLLPIGCHILDSSSLNDVDPEENDIESSRVTDVTRAVSRWLLNDNADEVPLRVSVNCEMSRNESVSSLRIVWMKTKMGSVAEGGRVRRNVKENAGGQHQGGGHNRRHHLSDFVAAEGEEIGMRGMRGGKKRGGDCGQMKHGKSCCRKPLTVSFEDLKITDVILAPVRFDMDYCEGRCNAKRLPYATTHAMFQHIINRSKNPDLTAPKLCCTPTKLSELDVIQVDPDIPNSLKVTVIHNAKVEECGCS